MGSRDLRPGRGRVDGSRKGRFRAADRASSIRLGGPQSGTIAWIWAAALLPLGLACLFRLHARSALWGSGALLLGAAGVWRWAGSCGCVVRLPAAAWVESAAMVVGAAAWLLAVLAGRAVPTPRVRFKGGAAGVLAAALLVGINAVPFHGGDAQAAAAPGTGVQLRIFLSATCPHCLANAPRVRELAASADLGPAAIFLGANSKEEIDTFFSNAGVTFDYVPLTMSQLGDRSPTVPRTELAAGDRILAEWRESVPGLDEVRAQIAKWRGAQPMADSLADPRE